MLSACSIIRAFHGTSGCAQDVYGTLGGEKIRQAALVEFRQTWDDSPRYAAKNIERLRSFFRFCQRLKWVGDNPALAVKPPPPSPTRRFRSPMPR